MSQASLTQSVFRGLSDPTRRQILLLLVKQEMTIGEVCARFPITRAAVRKHLTMLEEGGLITVQKRGREQVNRYEPAALQIAADWVNELNRFWECRLDNLKNTIEEENKQ